MLSKHNRGYRAYLLSYAAMYRKAAGTYAGKHSGLYKQQCMDEARRWLALAARYNNPTSEG